MKQTNKKILFLTRLYYPHVGGVEKHVNKITRELIQRNMHVTIVTELYDTQLKRKEQYKNLTIYRVPVGRNIFFKKFYIWWWLAKKLDVLAQSDIIHAHDVFYWVFPFRLLFPFKKFYVTFHGYEDYPIKIRWIVQRKVAELLSNGSICIGEFMKNWYKTSPSMILYGGVDVPKVFGKKPKNNSALFFGRLEEQTNVMEYAKASKKLKSFLPNFKLTIIGEGPLKKKLRNYGRNLKFDIEIEKKIKNYRYIFVSRYLSILEALANKRLVFAYFDNPLKEDYLKLSPFKKFIIIVGSEEELIDKLLFLSKNPKEREKLINAGYDWVKKQTWEKATSNYLDLWKIRRSKTAKEARLINSE